MFKQLLKFMYTGTCDLLKVGTCHVNFLSSTTDNSIQEIINNFGDVDFNDKQGKLFCYFYKHCQETYVSIIF